LSEKINWRFSNFGKRKFLQMTTAEKQIPPEYLKKECTFLKRKFYIDQRAHIPRKNTEPLVKFALQHIKKLKREVVCADIGTGAGVIAISLVLGSRYVHRVFATDLFSGAVAVAKKNVQKYRLEKRIILKRGSLLTPVRNEKIDIIVANLPHASRGAFEEKPHLAFEPKFGVLAGESGLELLEALFRQLVKYKNFLGNVSAIFLKISPDRTRETVKLAGRYLRNAKIATKKDNEGKLRYLIIEF
jgi:release factor glutamine methyltransferase